jgi:uncharacterized protein YoxC
MSGGSFNYLCYAEGLSELIGKMSYLEDMAKALSETGFSDEEATETQSIIDAMNKLDEMVQAKADSLHEVWKAVEWWYSCDRSKEDVLKAVTERRAK